MNIYQYIVQTKTRFQDSISLMKKSSNEYISPLFHYDFTKLLGRLQAM